MGVVAAVVRADWLALDAMWVASTSVSRLSPDEATTASFRIPSNSSFVLPSDATESEYCKR
jgi:hypothetical protein